MTEEFLQTAWHLIGSFVSVSLIEEATQDFKVLFFIFYVSIYCTSQYNVK